MGFACATWMACCPVQPHVAICHKAAARSACSGLAARTEPALSVLLPSLHDSWPLAAEHLSGRAGFSFQVSKNAEK